jgi:hypothetical protein
MLRGSESVTLSKPPGHTFRNKQTLNQMSGTNNQIST